MQTSTSFIIGTGLKKCRPPKRSNLAVELAMSAIGREDVLLAKIVCLKRERTSNRASSFIAFSAQYKYVNYDAYIYS